MIGYYAPAASPQELIYSRTARTQALLFGHCAVPSSFAALALGHAHLKFGGILPNNVARLQKHIPVCAELTDESVISGSAFHLLALGLDTQGRDRLVEYIFNGGPLGENYFGCLHLKFCPMCAREDREQSRPQHWRVLPNHPAVSCCDLHRIRLVTTGAKLLGRVLHNPAVWIDPDAVPLGSPMPEELAVAEDVRWLYEQRSDIIRGALVTKALRLLLLERYPKGFINLNRSAIEEEFKTRMGAAIQLDLGGRRASLNSFFFPGAYRINIRIYSLLAQLIGLRLKDLVALAGRDMRSETEASLRRSRPPKQEVTAAAEMPRQLMALGWKQCDEDCATRVQEVASRLPTWSRACPIVLLKTAGIPVYVVRRGVQYFPRTEEMVRMETARAKAELFSAKVEGAANRLAEVASKHFPFACSQIEVLEGYSVKVQRHMIRELRRELRRSGIAGAVAPRAWPIRLRRIQTAIESFPAS